MDKVTIAHGSGGKLMHALIENIFFKHFGNDILKEAGDSARLDLEAKKIAFTTDSFVVKPAFFPGGDIGKLAVCGTVNDLAVSGAMPKYISAAFIIEEGFLLSELEVIARSMRQWADISGVKVVTGDTKVVEKGEADGIFINTTGIGVIEDDISLGINNIKAGDKIIISGTIGDHGIAVLSKRKGLEFESGIVSDCRPLNRMLHEAMGAGGVRFMRDPTRGGLATTLNEIADKTGLGIVIDEESIPLSDGVRGACEILGLDPLYIANEGKAVIIAEPSSVKELVPRLRKNEYGKEAVVIGEVTKDIQGKVVLKTRLGTRRFLDMLTGEQLPRIC